MPNKWIPLNSSKLDDVQLIKVRTTTKSKDELYAEGVEHPVSVRILYDNGVF